MLSLVCFLVAKKGKEDVLWYCDYKPHLSTILRNICKQDPFYQILCDNVDEKVEYPSLDVIRVQNAYIRNVIFPTIEQQAHEFKVKMPLRGISGEKTYTRNER